MIKDDEGDTFEISYRTSSKELKQAMTLKFSEELNDESFLMLTKTQNIPIGSHIIYV